MRRRRRRQAKARASHYMQASKARGRSHRSTAKRLRVPVQTAHSWMSAHHAGRLETKSRGRPRTRVCRHERQSVVAALDATRGRISQATLRKRFPAVSRERVRRLHRAYRRRHGEPEGRTTWMRAGVAWAMDYTELADPVDGCMRWLMVVRDLASGMRLAWQATASADGATAIRTIERLVALHGAPLVIKSDNGSHFANAEMARLLDMLGIEHMLSPPRRPRYNGAIEADINGVKRRLDRIACDEIPSSAAVALACEELNLEVSPVDGRSPLERWTARSAITADRRAAFLAAVATAKLEEEKLITAGGTLRRPLSRAKRATVTRRAIRHTLEAQGELIITWSKASSSG